MNCFTCGKALVSNRSLDSITEHAHRVGDKCYCKNCCPMCSKDGELIIPDERIDTLRHITGTEQ